MRTVLRLSSSLARSPLGAMLRPARHRRAPDPDRCPDRAAPRSAQERGGIAGKVVQTRRPHAIPFATVTVVGAQKGGLTDAEGKFLITGHPARHLRGPGPVPRLRASSQPGRGRWPGRPLPGHRLRARRDRGAPGEDDRGRAPSGGWSRCSQGATIRSVTRGRDPQPAGARRSPTCSSSRRASAPTPTRSTCAAAARTRRCSS